MEHGSDRVAPKPIRTTPGAWTLDEIHRMPLQGFQRTLGLSLRTVRPDTIEAEIRIGPEHRNSVGLVHGGVILALADSLGAMGALQHLGHDQRTATLESKTNFIKPADGPLLCALCLPLHIGRRTSVWATRIEDGNGRLIAAVTQTQLHFVE